MGLRSGEVRVLDRMTEAVADVTLPVGIRPKRDVWRSHIWNAGSRCRTSAGRLAHLQIRDITQQEQVFDDWMVASSPALPAESPPTFGFTLCQHVLSYWEGAGEYPPGC